MEATLMIKKAQEKRRQRGFTLIELIAVIIILGILAAVIVPRYFNMTGNAQTAAGDGAISEGVARFNMGYGRFIMANAGTPPANLAALAPNFVNGTMDLGGYFVTVTQAGSTLTFTASRQGTPRQGEATAAVAIATPVGTPRAVTWPN